MKRGRRRARVVHLQFAFAVSYLPTNLYFELRPDFVVDKTGVGAFGVHGETGGAKPYAVAKGHRRMTAKQLAEAGQSIDHGIDVDTSSRHVSRPASAVSDITGVVGLIGFGATLVLTMIQDFPLTAAMLLHMIGAALPMVLWTVLVEKVHRRPSTGPDFALSRPRAEVTAIVSTKLIGLVATFTIIALAYFSIKT